MPNILFPNVKITDLFAFLALKKYSSVAGIAFLNKAQPLSQMCMFKIENYTSWHLKVGFVALRQKQSLACIQWHLTI